MTVVLSHDLTRMATALERIAEALEAQAAADPLTMLSIALDEEGGLPGVTPDAVPSGPQGPVASNGFTVVYRHPDPESGLEIVARRDESVDGGWRVEVEPK